MGTSYPDLESRISNQFERVFFLHTQQKQEENLTSEVNLKIPALWGTREIK